MNKKQNLYYELSFALLALIAVALAVADISGHLSVQLKTPCRYIEWSIQCIFTIDYGLRLWHAPKKSTFIRYNIADLLAILPLSSFFRVFRLARLFKLARLSKALPLLRFIALSNLLHKRLHGFFRTNGLRYVLLFTTALLLVSSFVIAHLENMSYFNGFWWAFVTTTTVGYGDVSPHTTGGRILAMVLMLNGIGTISMITGSVATFFLRHPEKSLNTSSQLEENIRKSIELSEPEKEELIHYLSFLKSKRFK